MGIVNSAIAGGVRQRNRLLYQRSQLFCDRFNNRRDRLLSINT
ncbi:hypothetical protein AB3R30_10555 [Leptolyngbyaceae cyanobacterium UHCC 1019]